MDEAARTSGPALDDRKRGPDEIREDIEQTREELGETVEALELFGLIAAFAAGMLVRSIAGS